SAPPADQIRAPPRISRRPKARRESARAFAAWAPKTAQRGRACCAAAEIDPTLATMNLRCLGFTGAALLLSSCVEDNNPSATGATGTTPATSITTLNPPDVMTTTTGPQTGTTADPTD